MSQPHIFVSYSRKDRAFTQRLVSDLHNGGAEVWVDVEGITAGNFMQAIDEALSKCEWMVLVLTPDAIASEYVKQETYTALHRVAQGHMRAVIPLLAAPCAPGSIPPQWDVLQRYDATQDYGAALAGVLRAVGLSLQPSESVADLITRGKALLDQMQYVQAIPLFERATQLAPDSFDAWCNLGYIHAEVQQWGAAVAAYARALVLKPNDAATWNNKARALVILDCGEEALDAAERAVSLQAGYADAWTNKAAALAHLGRYQEALDAAERAISLQPNHYRAWACKTLALLQLGRDQEQLAAGEKVAVMGPVLQEWRDRATALRALGHYAEAQEAARRARELGG